MISHRQPLLALAAVLASLAFPVRADETCEGKIVSTPSECCVAGDMFGFGNDGHGCDATVMKEGVGPWRLDGKGGAWPYVFPVARELRHPFYR